jgi:hypothetical protein
MLLHIPLIKLQDHSLSEALAKATQCNIPKVPRYKFNARKSLIVTRKHMQYEFK